jgi:hypothetical protein
MVSWSNPVLGGFQMLIRFHHGSHCENRLTILNVRTRLKTDLRFSHGRELVQMYTIFFWRADRFSHRTQIRFSEFSVPFIGSSCSSSHLGLLLFSCCYYFFPIALILFLLLLLFSHGVALSV